MRGARRHKRQQSSRRVALRRPAEPRDEVLSATVRCVGEAILSSDARGRLTWANPAAEQLLGQDLAELHGQPINAVLPLRALDGGPLPHDPFDLVGHTGQPVRFEASLAGQKKRLVVAATIASVHAGKEHLGLVLTLRDVTELLDTRQQLEFSERLAALGTLAAGVAHEVNNPLAVVVASLGFALDLGPLDPAVASALHDARDATARVTTIVQSLRDFSRPHVEAFRPHDPREAFGTALHLTHAQLRTIAGVSLELGPVPSVMAVPARLAQVVVALVINALQSMRPLGGHRLLTLSSTTDERGWAVLSVTDEGPGINPAVARRIFDPFFTTKAPGEGSGLGLSIARSIVESHQGVLSVDASPTGSGACFRVCLPPCEEAAPARTPLMTWWVGPPTEASARLCAGREIRLGEDLSATIGADLLLLNVSPAELSVLHARHPDLDLRGLLVDRRPPPGLRSISTKDLTPHGLTALIRRWN